jgi:hypothetical protein
MWMCKIFNIKKEIEIGLEKFQFNMYCKNGNLKICMWFCETFHITKDLILFPGITNSAFYIACEYEHYEIICYLYFTFGITEEEVKEIIKEFQNEKQDKILKCCMGFGSFTKPVKN